MTILYNRTTKLILWDLGGQSSLRILWEKYYSECNIILYILDSSKFSFEQRVHEHQHELNKLLSDNVLIDCSIVICCNKIDLNNNLTIEQIHSQLHITESATTSYRSIKYMECSGLNGTNVELIMKWCVDTIQSSQRRKRINAINV